MQGYPSMASTSTKSAVARITGIPYSDIDELETVRIPKEEQDAVLAEIAKIQKAENRKKEKKEVRIRVLSWKSAENLINLTENVTDSVSAEERRT